MATWRIICQENSDFTGAILKGQRSKFGELSKIVISLCMSYLLPLFLLTWISKQQTSATTTRPSQLIPEILTPQSRAVLGSITAPQSKHSLPFCGSQTRSVVTSFRHYTSLVTKIQSIPSHPAWKLFVYPSRKLEVALH
jgi:hypothetical protein